MQLENSEPQYYNVLARLNSFIMKDIDLFKRDTFLKRLPYPCLYAGTIWFTRKNKEQWQKQWWKQRLPYPLSHHKYDKVYKEKINTNINDF